MKNKMHLFNINVMVTQETLIRSVYTTINYYKKNLQKGNSMACFHTAVSLLEQLHEYLSSYMLPPLNNWWYYEYRITLSAIELNMCCCEDASYFSDGKLNTLKRGQVITLKKFPCEMLSVEQFAAENKVTPLTVTKWIKKGRLRAIEKRNNQFFIPSLTPRPRPTLTPATYSWETNISELTEEYPFLETCQRLHVSQCQTDKNCCTLLLYSNDNNTSVEITLSKATSETLEASLLTTKGVTVNTSLSDIVFDRVPLKSRNSSLYKQLLERPEFNDDDSYLGYGPVIVTGGKHRGRIGYYDDDEHQCIVYFGSFYHANSYYMIKAAYLSNLIPTLSLVERIESLTTEIYLLKNNTNYQYELLAELQLCNELLFERYNHTMYNNSTTSHKIFISHASQDLTFARALATDLRLAGYDIFLDDWSIELGENIVQRINEGLDTSSALIPVISEHFLQSVYCRDEWTAYYMKFSKSSPNSIYPLILDASEVPPLLAPTKYARIDVNTSYNQYLSQLLRALDKHLNRN